MTPGLTWLFLFADSAARCFSSSMSYSLDLSIAIARSLFCPCDRCSEQKILMPAGVTHMLLMELLSKFDSIQPFLML